MFSFLKILTQRPSDTNIRLFKIVFGLILSVGAYYSFFISGVELQDSLPGENTGHDVGMYIKYFVIGLGIIPIITGILDLNLLKSKYTRILHILFGIDLLYIMNLMKETPTLGFDSILLLLGIVAIISGITGKFITKKGLRAAQKITKIRV